MKIPEIKAIEWAGVSYFLRGNYVWFHKGYGQKERDPILPFRGKLNRRRPGPRKYYQQLLAKAFRTSGCSIN